MKRFVPILCLILTSCAPSLQDNIKDAQLKTMKDPTSYELLSLDKYKDITYREEIDARIEQQKNNKESAERFLDLHIEFENEDDAQKDRANIEKANSIIAALEELKAKKADSLDIVAATIYIHKFNGKNSLGTIVPNCNFAIVLPDGTIKGFAESENDIPRNPNDFSEYYNIIK